jgi:holo-[acyl-carrier protein] synthase
MDELFGPGELAWCRRRRRAAEGYAMAYAAKEALFKALGTGKVGRMAWHDVRIDWDGPGRRPAMTLEGETGAVAQRLGATAVHLALAGTKEIGTAWVVLTGDHDQ